MKKQRRDWNVYYDKNIDSLPEKLKVAEKYLLFRVRLFGGVLAVVARSFINKRLAGG